MAADVLDAILAAEQPVIIPGIAAWLGVPAAADDTASSYDAYLEQLSKEAA
ncbi:hypothetical protein [Streptomyces sp. NPDC059786]|uniref:hypothetical protein n=1 Tax=Streptomyces sp. NPDC059786 TaxID=3346946 RepID=UPI00365653DB